MKKREGSGDLDAMRDRRAARQVAYAHAYR
jgi:hypothetical protein